MGLILGCLSLCGSVNAAKLEISFKKPESYRDIYAGEGHQKNFEKSVFEELENHFQKLAAKLPDEQLLKITINDLDLAGDVHLGGIERVRIVKDMYYPRVAMNFELVSGQQQTLMSGEVNLKDINFMTGRSLKYRHSILSYEKKMLDEWFSKTFLE